MSSANWDADFPGNGALAEEKGDEKSDPSTALGRSAALNVFTTE